MPGFGPFTIISALGIDQGSMDDKDKITVHPRPIFLEALCGRCGETFIPNDESDLDHFQRQDGTDCGGRAKKIIGHSGPHYKGKHRRGNA